MATLTPQQQNGDPQYVVGTLSPPQNVDIAAAPIAGAESKALEQEPQATFQVGTLSPPADATVDAVPLTVPPPAAAASYSGAQVAPEVAVAGAQLGYTIIKDLLIGAGDITYDLYKLDGIKSPADDRQWENQGTWRRGTIHVRAGVFETNAGDEQSVEFDVEFGYNGHCIRDVIIKPTKTNDALAWKLHVTETIVPRPDLEKPPPDSVAAVEVTFIYRHYSAGPYSDAIYHETLILYGDGSHTESGRWTS